MPSQSRRAYLRALALGGASALAGCPGNGATDSDTPASDGGGTSPDSTTTDEPTTTATPEPRLGGAVTPRSDAATGEELWTHEISDETDGVPEPEDAVVGEDAILVAAGQRLRVLDPATDSP
jgi:hypothetical protein